MEKKYNTRHVLYISPYTSVDQPLWQYTIIFISWQQFSYQFMLMASDTHLYFTSVKISAFTLDK